MTISKLKEKLHKNLDHLPLQVLLEINELVNSRMQKKEIPDARKFGSLKGMLTYMAPDFDAPL